MPFADVGELDAVAACPRDLVADVDLRLQRLEQRAHRLDARVDAQRPAGADRRLPRVEGERVARADERRPDPKRAPAVAAQGQLDPADTRANALRVPPVAFV